MKTGAVKTSEKNAAPKKIESTIQAQTNEPAITPEFSDSINLLQKKSICPCDGQCPNCSSDIQRKLKIGAPNDKYEQEANQMADRVMRMPEPMEQRQEDELEEEEEPIQTKSLSNQSQPLPGSTRAFFEPRFNRDFSNVMVHTGSQSAQMNKDLNAQAFTHGNNIYFNQEKYSPYTDAGKHLLAHELTHVIQQRHGEIRRKSDLVPPRPLVNNTPAETMGTAIGQENKIPAKPRKEREITAATTQEPSPKALAEHPKVLAEPPKVDKIKQEPAVKSKEKKPLPRVDQIKESEEGKPGTSSEGGGDVQEVKQLEMSGSSDQAMESFTTSKASQIAVSFPVLGSTLDGKLKSEQKEAAENLPPLKAQSGTDGIPVTEVKPEQLKEKNAEISEGVTEPEPKKQETEPHQNLAPAPGNKKNNTLLDQQEPSGFLSWFKSNFKDFMSRIATKDTGVNTDAGNRPTIDTSGKADPNRVENQRQEGQNQLEDQNRAFSDKVKNNPGQENIQPQPVNEAFKGEMSSETETGLETQPVDDMTKYASMPLPQEVRDKADEKMVPLLAESMAAPRQEVATAASQRDEGKKKATDEAHEKAATLNHEADNEQSLLVKDSRKAVADEQNKCIEEAQNKIDEFNKEADSEQKTIKTSVTDRIAKDEGEATKKLEKAEEDAEKKREEGEENARKKKKELEDKSKDRSLLDRAVDAVKSVVKAVTEAIDVIFDAVRSAVKIIIETAKNAALTLIEAGRKWVVEQLDNFGTWLKQKVSTYLSAFPALAKTINAAIDSAVKYAKEEVNKIADQLKESVTALADTLAGAIDSVLNAFQTGLKATVQIVGAVLTGDFAEAAKIAFYAVMDIAGIDPKPIMDFINKAGETINIIFNDPIAFFKNVANGVKRGLDNFLTNIKTHLINGLFAWLTGALSDVKITLPEKFDLKGIFSLAAQILGLTYQNIRGKLVKKLGPKGEKIITFMEKSYAFINDLITKGPVVLWEKAKEYLGNLRETVVSGIQDWVTDNIIKAGITWLLSLLNPVSAIIKAVKMLYDLVMFFVKRAKQIVAFVQSVFNSVGELARGNLDKAATAVENALGNSVPVIIGLLASLIGLGGIGKAVNDTIEKVRNPIDKGMDKAIDWLVEKGKALWNAGKDALNKGNEKLINWWRQKKDFMTKDGKQHSLFFEGEGENAKLVVASTPIKNLREKIEGAKIEAGKKDELLGQVDSIYDSVKKEQDPEDNDKKEEIQEQLQTISDYLIESGILDEDSPPLTHVTHEMSEKKAHKVVAEPLSKHAGNTIGKGTPGTAIAKGFELCQLIHSISSKRAKGNRLTRYHQTHLLSARLHGPAVDWNLAPTPSRVNTSDMYHGVEKKVIEMINDKDNPAVLSYKTTVKYEHKGKKYFVNKSNYDLNPKLKNISPKDFPSSIEVKVKKGELKDGKYTFDSTADMPKLDPVSIAAPVLPDEAAEVRKKSK
jgi:Domain of unknown function (DUF4157)